MTSNLIEAAALLRNATRDAEDDQSLRPAERHARRMQLADAFTRLAAIEAGLPPCLGGHETDAPKEGS
jgi:hypothetical protein